VLAVVVVVVVFILKGSKPMPHLCPPSITILLLPLLPLLLLTQVLSSSPSLMAMRKVVVHYQQ